MELWSSLIAEENQYEAKTHGSSEVMPTETESMTDSADGMEEGNIVQDMTNPDPNVKNTEIEREEMAKTQT
jgi:hypothetical protein